MMGSAPCTTWFQVPPLWWTPNSVTVGSVSRPGTSAEGSRQFQLTGNGSRNTTSAQCGCRPSAWHGLSYRRRDMARRYYENQQQCPPMTKTMRESAHLLAAHQTLSEVPEMASTRIRTALTFLVDCVHTSAGIRNGDLRPNAGKLSLTGRADASEMQRRRAELALQAFASNLPRAAQAIAISAAHNALSEKFGKLPDPNQPRLSELDALRWFVCLVQCCYAHDPLRPRWKIDAP